MRKCILTLLAVLTSTALGQFGGLGGGQSTQKDSSSANPFGLPTGGFSLPGFGDGKSSQTDSMSMSISTVTVTTTAIKDHPDTATEIATAKPKRADDDFIIPVVRAKRQDDEPTTTSDDNQPQETGESTMTAEPMITGKPTMKDGGDQPQETSTENPDTTGSILTRRRRWAH